MYLKNDKIVMTVGNTTFYSHKIVPTPIFLFDQTALIGWLDGADIKRNSSPRPTSDGDFPERMNFSSRMIIATGIAIANSIQQIHDMRDEFIGLLAHKEYYPISVTDNSGTRFSTVSLGNKSGWIQETDTTAVWKLELYAPDPYIYGYPQKTTFGADIFKGGLSFPLGYPLDFDNNNVIQGDKVITNRGNATMWPTFIVRGEFYTGFSISDTSGKKVTYNGMVTTSDPVLIDMAKGTATQSSTDKSYFLSDRNWLSVPPKGSNAFDFNPLQNGTGWCEAIYQDTWI